MEFKEEEWGGEEDTHMPIIPVAPHTTRVVHTEDDDEASMQCTVEITQIQGRRSQDTESKSVEGKERVRAGLSSALASSELHPDLHFGRRARKKKRRGRGEEIDAHRVDDSRIRMAGLAGGPASEREHAFAAISSRCES